MTSIQHWKEQNICETIREMGSLVSLIYDYAKHWRLDNFDNMNKFLEDNKDNSELSADEKSSLVNISTKYPEGEVLKFFTNDADLECVIGKNPHKKRFTLIFRGSEGFWDWVYDMCIFKVSIGNCGVKVHSGFHKQLMYNDTFNKICDFIQQYNTEEYKDWKWVISGHSLGGALSILSGYLLSERLPEINWTVISFASPKVGNRIFKTDFELRQNLRHYRICNNYDLVTSIPTFWYCHTGYNLWYSCKDKEWKHFGYRAPEYSYYLYNYWNPYDHICSRYVDNLKCLTD